jgi:hypothetical protein
VLLGRGCQVVFASRLNRLVPLLESARAETTVKRRLYPQPFEFVGDCVLGRIDADSVTIRSLYGAADRVVAADAVVIVGSNDPQRQLSDALGDRGEVSLVGDALGPRFLQIALTEAHRAAQRD